MSPRAGRTRRVVVALIWVAAGVASYEVGQRSAGPLCYLKPSCRGTAPSQKTYGRLLGEGVLDHFEVVLVGHVESPNPESLTVASPAALTNIGADGWFVLPIERGQSVTVSDLRSGNTGVVDGPEHGSNAFMAINISGPRITSVPPKEGPLIIGSPTCLAKLDEDPILEDSTGTRRALPRNGYWVHVVPTTGKWWVRVTYHNVSRVLKGSGHGRYAAPIPPSLHLPKGTPLGCGGLP